MINAQIAVHAHIHQLSESEEVACNLSFVL